MKLARRIIQRLLVESYDDRYNQDRFNEWLDWMLTQREDDQAWNYFIDTFRELRVPHELFVARDNVNVSFELPKHRAAYVDLSITDPTMFLRSMMDQSIQFQIGIVGWMPTEYGLRQSPFKRFQIKKDMPFEKKMHEVDAAMSLLQNMISQLAGSEDLMYTSPNEHHPYDAD